MSIEPGPPCGGALPMGSAEHRAGCIQIRFGAGDGVVARGHVICRCGCGQRRGVVRVRLACGRELSAQGDESVAVTLRDVVVLLGDFPRLRARPLSQPWRSGDVDGPKTAQEDLLRLCGSFRLLEVKARRWGQT